MTSAPIEGPGCTIYQLFNGFRYQLDCYQREYTWEGENVRRLVEDLYRRFSAEWDERHDRTQASRYKPTQALWLTQAWRRGEPGMWFCHAGVA